MDGLWMCIISHILKMYKYVFQEGFHDSTKEVVFTEYFPMIYRVHIFHFSYVHSKP
jgi:hypothetical protein